MPFLKVRPNAAGIARPKPARIATFCGEHLEIRMFYVGHGEVNLIVFPDRRAWIVEVGSGNGWPDNNALGALLAQYLVHEGLTLDAMVMAHAHKDHVGAVPALLEAGGYDYTSPLRLFRNESSSWRQVGRRTSSRRSSSIWGECRSHPWRGQPGPRIFRP